MKMKYFLSSFSILFCSFVFFSSNSVSESNRFETQTILNSFDLLPQTVISTNYYRIDQTVLNDGYLNKFHIRSQFGDQFVLGSSMLAIRINELKALNELSKISSAKVIKDSALDNGEKIITTPINVGKKVIGLVEDPDKIITTAKSIPDGVGNIFSWASRQVQGGLEYANKQMFDESKKKSKNNSDDLDSENETTEKAVELAKKSGLKYIKYSSAEREWFKKLSVDQYTDNEQLQNEIERVAGIQTAMSHLIFYLIKMNLN
jgi:hypothetical protein